VEFAVAGTGIGIAKEERATIFAMFRQADNSETQKFEGFGQGLFIAKRFAQLMGGDIVVVSELGRVRRLPLPSLLLTTAATPPSMKFRDSSRQPLETIKTGICGSGLNQGDYRKCLLAEGILSLQKQ